jgi:putative hydrolase of the HAD superfamily
LEARKELLARYKSIEGTLAWTDLDYWSEKLDLDIPALKLKINHLIQVHPYVIDFLQYCRSIKKEVHLVTNAHSKTLDIKIRKTDIGSYFDRIICSGDIGLPKENPRFWNRLEALLNFDKAWKCSFLLADRAAGQKFFTRRNFPPSSISKN